MPAIFPFAAVLLLLPILLVLIAVRATGFRESRAAYLSAWLSALFVAWRLADFPPLQEGLLATLTVEMPLAVGYTLWRKLPAALLLTVVWGMNTVTRPLLSFAVVALHPWIGYSLSWLVLFELLIWIVEAAILAAAMRKQTPFWEALLLSLALNAASFGIGLLLPVP